MASNTENLNLLMKNPSTDGADTFNVQTMLNENWQKIDANAGTVAQTLANILKPTTPPIIGLPPSTTPDGMFQALGNTGELHVWRKTVTTAQEIPAKYELGELQTGSFQFVGSSYVTWEYGTPNVGDDGTVSLVSPGSSNVNYSSNLNDLRGKYCKPNQASGVFLANQVIFIPSDAVFTQSGSAKYISKYQSVIGTPKTPAGTTTTYPVSTNPNAYQEGDDAKPAGYTLLEVVSGSYLLGSANSGQNYYYKTATSLSVSDDGTLSMPSNAEQVNLVYSANGLTTDHIKSSFAGKFVQLSSTGADLYYNSLFKTTPSEILLIPNEAIITKGSDKCFYIDRYQPVTGYAAIPAGTTIEYLGKLGDKARVQVVSYVGTGTYGSSNPNSLTFDFVPKILFIKDDNEGQYYICLTLFGTRLTDTYKDYTFFDATGNMNYPSASYARKKGKNIQWYSLRNAYVQANGPGLKYIAIAIG